MFFQKTMSTKLNVKTLETNDLYHISGGAAGACTCNTFSACNGDGTVDSDGDER